MPHTHNPSHSHGNKCFCTPKIHCALYNEDSDTEAESDWMDFEGIFEDAGVTCQNRKWMNMSRPDFTCFLTHFLLLQELGEASTLQDNKHL